MHYELHDLLSELILNSKIATKYIYGIELEMTILLTEIICYLQGV